MQTTTKRFGQSDDDDAAADDDKDSLELFFLNVAAAIIVQDGEDLLDILGALLGEATHLEEPLGAEAVWCCTHDGDNRNSIVFL